MNFNEKELEILDFWKKNQIFEKSLKKNEKGPVFVFYDGPITVNAQPGIHHVEARIYKDIIPRYKTMQGFNVPRKNGWDTHGLPVELQVEKKLGFRSKKDIENYGIEKFNEECKKTVDELIPVFRQMTERIGYWVDMDNPYITYQPEYIETLWWILKQIWDKKLLYEDFKVVPWCTRCGTALSSHELALGYENIRENSVYLKIKLEPGQKIKDFALKESTYILSWTTTPWTLPGNVALAAGEKMTYVLAEKNDEQFILAKSRLTVLEEDYKIVKEFLGKDLEDLKYRPLFDIKELRNENSHKVYLADFVTEKEGTGIVHIAVMYGQDDFELGQKYNLPKIHTVKEDGKFNELVNGFTDQIVKHPETEKKLIEYLKQNNLLFREETVNHDYPFCWRCKQPLLYYAKQSWFIKVTEIKEKLIAANEKINWIPEHLKNGRFGEWLHEVKDWAITRERYWGTPFPVWRCQMNKFQIPNHKPQTNPKSQILNSKECDNIKVVGSFEELETLSGQKINDPHRPHIDNITFKCEKCGGEMKREPYVIDVWFDSGAMPFASASAKTCLTTVRASTDKQAQKSNVPDLFPADYIAEAIDQTRGWFYTLLAISVLLGHESPYKTVLCLGHVLDKKGEKMSKSKGNVVVPDQIIQKYGVDALRWYFFTVNQPENSKRFDEVDVKKALQKLLTLKNSFNFLNFYTLDTTSFRLQDLENFKPKNILDQWLLTKLKGIIQDTTKCLDDFQIVKAARLVEDFTGDISYKYIHWSRPRFKSTSPDRKEALKTLVKTFLELSKLVAPFLPFLSEELYQSLKNGLLKSVSGINLSIHLENWPKTEKLTAKEKNILNQVLLLEQVIGLGLRARKNSQLKVRQPLAELKLNVNLGTKLSKIAKEELNVKKITNDQNLKSKKNWIFDKEGSIQVLLNIELTDDLKKEGIAKELARNSQIVRKNAKLMPQDKIKTNYVTDSQEIISAIETNTPYLMSVTGSASISINEDNFSPDHEIDAQINNQSVKIGIKAL